MERQTERTLKRLEEKIEKAKRSNDYFKIISLLKERDEIISSIRRTQQTTLADALQALVPDRKREFISKIITGVVFADLLNAATMDILDDFKKIGINGIPMIEKLRQVSKDCAAAVRTIDDLKNYDFSINYMEVVDVIETKCFNTLKNYIFNEVAKSENL